MVEAELIVGEPLKSETLDHLPLAAAFGHQLRIIETIDEHAAAHPEHAVSHGQCVFAMVMSVLCGRYPLYKVEGWLESVARDVVFGKDICASHFHDTRLAVALDAIYEAGVMKVFSEIVLEAIAYYKIETHRLHGDTTSVSVYGDYAQADPEVLGVLHGHSKNHRPDLKQLIFGLVVSGDGGVPVLGQLHDGNQSDHETNRFQLSQLRQVVPNLVETTLVYDSKFFDAKTLGLAKEQGFHWITLVPASSGKKAEMIDKALEHKELLTVLRTKAGRRKGEQEVFKGISFVDEAEIELPEEGEEKESPVRQQMPVRYVVVHSTQLSKRQARTLEKHLSKENQRLSEALKELCKRGFVCQEDALREAQKWNKTQKAHYHEVGFETQSMTKRVKRSKRGRPAKGEEPGVVEEWVLRGSLKRNGQAIKEQQNAQGYFVLATDHVDKEQVSDTDVLAWYKEQYEAEGSFSWLKGPAAFAPIFLKKVQRIMAMGLVFMMALMIYTLIERQIRRKLSERDETIKGNNSVDTHRPTTAVVFKHFEGIRRVWREEEGESRAFIEGFMDVHQRILGLLGLTTKVYSLSAKILTAPT